MKKRNHNYLIIIPNQPRSNWWSARNANLTPLQDEQKRKERFEKRNINNPKKLKK